MHLGISIVLLLLFFMALCGRWLAGLADPGRIRRHIEARGGKLLSSEWRLVGPGWLAWRTQRMYEIHYLDCRGAEHHAFCQTSAFGGVYFSEDEIRRRAPFTPPVVTPVVSPVPLGVAPPKPMPPLPPHRNRDLPLDS